MRDIDADPLPVQLLRRVDRSAATTKGIEHGVAFVRRKRPVGPAAVGALGSTERRA